MSERERTAAAQGEPTEREVFDDPAAATVAYLRATKPTWGDDRREQGGAAVAAAVELLRERGMAQKHHFIDEIRPEHPVGYATGDAAAEAPDGRDRGGWWRHVVRPMLKRHPDAVRDGRYWFDAAAAGVVPMNERVPQDGERR